MAKGSPFFAYEKTLQASFFASRQRLFSVLNLHIGRHDAGTAGAVLR